MKILLFNLGSIEHRIISWDVEGYKTLFEHDIILWGPIPDSEFSLNGKKIPIISFNEPVCIKDVFNRLPEGWIPDIVTCDTSVLIYVQDIYLCPVKTILFTRDAWADTIFNRKLVELFDFVSHSIVDIKAYEKLHSKLLPLASFPVSIPDSGLKSPEFRKRDIDVIAIANYNEGFYYDRYKTMYNLAATNKVGLKIQYFSGLKRKEIHEYYRRSKIVFDWAHTLSNRSYEAALNGCLLFSHEANTAMKSFWEPWREYIPYNSSNLYDLINFYIRNPEKADEIINRTAVRIKTIPVSFGQYTLENINLAMAAKADIQHRAGHAEKLTLCDLHYRTATPFSYNYRYETTFPPNWESLYFARIDKALALAVEEDNLAPPVIEAARIAFLAQDFSRCLEYLEKLEIFLPDYAWIYYLRGRIFYTKKEHKPALKSLEEAISSLIKSPFLVQEYVMPFIEKDLNCDGRRITDYLWQSVYDHKNEFQVRALSYMTLQLIGDIYNDLKEFDKALEAYQKAIDHLPVPDSVKKCASLLIKSGNFDKLLEISEKGTIDSPFENTLVLYKAYALLRKGRKLQAFKILRDHQKALKSFPGTRKIEILQKILTLPPLLGFINKKAGAKSILILIKALNKL